MPKGWLILLLFGLIARAHAQDADPDFLNFEFEFGLGYARSNDINIFNDQQGIALGGGVGFNLAFRYHFNYNWSAGLHLLVSADEITEYDPDLVLGYNSSRNLPTSNASFGFHGKYTFDLRRWQPWVMTGLGVAFGDMTHLDFEEPLNQFTGISMFSSIGMGYMVSNQTMISVSMGKNSGMAWWKYLPSDESINKEFDPGFWSILMHVSLFLGNQTYYDYDHYDFD